jgi:acetyl-CoA carboxylase carboxyltransferase component|tara:strand:- start:236 stop:463 length:228 start_codon:yes stop_codon:yes gene_type:complete
MGTIYTTHRHTSASGVARIYVSNNTNNNINIFRDNSSYENMNNNEEIPPKYTEIDSIDIGENINNLVPDNELPPY